MFAVPVQRLLSLGLWIGLLRGVLAVEETFLNRGCDTHVLLEDAAMFERQFHELRRRQMPDVGSGTGQITPRTFNVFWNAITSNETMEGGWVSQDQIDAQIDVLNSDYAEANISWRLGGVKYIHNRDWFENAAQGMPEENEMKFLFHTGDATTLNVYSIAFNSTTRTLGYSTIPQWYSDMPWADGIVLRFNAVAGGTIRNYQLGRTLTHEAGHWLGLYHTFQGGCDGNGDFVDDTPPEAEASQGCPLGRDSCVGGGPDPVQNFMDYSYDECMTGFTPGQIQRMHAHIEVYRQPGLNYTFPYWSDIESTQRVFFSS